jgi:hypothetical protein
LAKGGRDVSEGEAGDVDGERLVQPEVADRGEAQGDSHGEHGDHEGAPARSEDGGRARRSRGNGERWAVPILFRTDVLSALNSQVHWRGC